MSGDPASSVSALNDFDDIKEKVDGYEAKLGLPTLPAKNECDALSLTGNEISKLNPGEILEYSADLAAYSLYIKRILNKENGYLRWLNNKINLTIAGELQSYAGYYSHEQRRAVAILGNSYARQLEELRMNCQLKVDVLEGLTFEINQLCKILINIRIKTWQDQH